ncbi:MAG: alpha/beta hydrolase [Coriobacteriia bacterium]|nr:alpha/beta hydrolase [Coriobacteriia bacterium]
MTPNLSRGMQSVERSHVRLALLATTAVIVIGLAMAVVWILTPLGPTPKALEALGSDGTVTVTTGAEGWLFAPADGSADAGLVLYPGGRVDARSYAPLARAIAQRGYTVALASMPLSLAVLDPGRAETLMDSAPEVVRWAVGGHSLGGAMAAAYATTEDDRVAGLVLLAAYPAASTDLTASGLAVLSIIGTEDRVVDPEVFAEAVERLPADTTYLKLDGGNHAQFGDYGRQTRDGEATITREEQIRATADAVAGLLEHI